MSYKTSHRGRLPRSLREVGIDSLTSATVRRLAIQDGEPLVTVLYRGAAGRRVRACSGGREALDEATLSGGAFTVDCTITTGSTVTFRAGGSSRLR